MSSPLEGFFFHDFSNSYIAEILKEIYIDKVYEPFLLGKKNLVILDVGANIGLTTYYFKDYAAQVVAVEPSRIHIEALAQMIKFNNIKNVAVVPFAISKVNSVVPLYHNTNKTMYGLDARLGSSGHEITMALSLDEIIKFFRFDRVDFLKLDPEGEEGNIVFSDGFKSIAPMIKTIVGEYHVWCSVGKDEFQKKLEELGYKFSWLSSEGASLYSATR